ncbi:MULTISPECIES: hypothetical protein [unclassified Bartonella]
MSEAKGEADTKFGIYIPANVDVKKNQKKYRVIDIIFGTFWFSCGAHS